MIIPLTLGKDAETGRHVSLNADMFRTHLHLLGATGTGKTTAVHTLLHSIIMSPRPRAAVFVVDPMGNLSRDLLRWMANTRLCPQHVRDRLLYIEPARENVVLPFNPLLHDSTDHLYYRVGRAVEIVLRGWASQNIEEMPRLRRWCFNSFFAVAAMGLPIASCQYLLKPGSREHQSLLQQLPEKLRLDWAEILGKSSQEAVRLLESTRNRLAPFFDSGILRRMFATVEGRFDVERFIRERRVVILNVASYNRLDRHIGNTIGGLVVNEILERASNLTPKQVDPTYLLLDEFQFFVGPDLYDALPTVRQLGLRLILAHQSFAQLERGDIDLSGLIWQARSRLMFANDAEDADRIAHELATITFDPKRLKEELRTRRQRIAGHEKVTTHSSSYSESRNESETTQTGRGTASNQATAQRDNSQDLTRTDSQQRSENQSAGKTVGKAITEGSTTNESFLPIHEDFEEVSSRSYYSFDEQRTQWAQRVRQMRTGEALGKFRDDPKLYRLLIDRHIVPETPASERAMEELLERNFASEFFRSAAQVEQEEDRLRQSILGGAREPAKLPNNRLDDSSDFEA